MMLLPFIKMQGLGNDFVMFDRRNDTKINFTSKQIQHIANRKYGIGCDQIILINSDTNYDCDLQIFNADGSESFACGNATRCIARIINKENIQIKVGNRILAAQLVGDNVMVNMGKAKFAWKDIPLAHATDTLNLTFDHPVLSHGFAVNIGNPHLVFIVDNVNDLDVPELGQFFSIHPLFPKQTNVNFVSIKNKNELELKVFERGSGSTMACGSGACATTAVLERLGLINRSVTVSQAGGNLSIDVKPQGIFMTGAAEFSFKGTIEF